MNLDEMFWLAGMAMLARRMSRREAGKWGSVLLALSCVLVAIRKFA
jgi:hypothetical protein